MKEPLPQDEEPIVFGNHVVCLLDVLGQADELKKWQNLPAIATPELLEALRNTAGAVLCYRDNFERQFRELETKRRLKEYSELPPEQQKQYDRVMGSHTHVERFSDSFVFSCLLQNDHRDTVVTAIYHALVTCCCTMLLSLAGKKPIRGAVSVGAGAILPDSSFYGPALADVHQLESKVAGYPRIVISKELFRNLAPRSQFSSDRLVHRCMTTLSTTCRSLVFEDVDGVLTLDFIGEGIQAIWSLDHNVLDMLRPAFAFVKSEAIRFRSERNAKLALRYYLLQQYMESRLPLWNIQPEEALKDDQ